MENTPLLTLKNHAIHAISMKKMITSHTNITVAFVQTIHIGALYQVVKDLTEEVAELKEQVKQQSKQMRTQEIMNL